MSEDTYYLTTQADEKQGGLIAVISLGHPQLGDENITVVSVTRVASKEEAESWYRTEMEQKPWEVRQ